MRPTKEQLIALQKEWYQKLADCGFEDIEKLRGNKCVLITKSRFRFFNTNYKVSKDDTAAWDLARKTDEEYYRCWRQQLNGGEFFCDNAIDAYIIELFVEGEKIQTIVEKLKDAGHSKTRKTVRLIIRRYEHDWGIKHYTWE